MTTPNTMTQATDNAIENKVTYIISLLADGWSPDDVDAEVKRSSTLGPASWKRVYERLAEEAEKRGGFASADIHSYLETVAH